MKGADFVTLSLSKGDKLKLCSLRAFYGETFPVDPVILSNSYLHKKFHIDHPADHGDDQHGVAGGHPDGENEAFLTRFPRFFIFDMVRHGCYVEIKNEMGRFFSCRSKSPPAPPSTSSG